VLHQNQPNPFNSSTVIHYTLSSGDSPRIEIFNTAGQRVRYLSFPFQLVGDHYVAWDGTNDRGEPVASGTYLYRLTSGGTSLTKKMLLIK
jgi:flagellar hook assembly protein FlgD